MQPDVLLRIRSALSPALLDLEDRLKSEAFKAHVMIRDGSGLKQLPARALEGQARYRMMENGFQEVCAEHGAVLLDGSVVPTTDLKVYQPFMRFGGSEPGVILGLATMPAPSTLPPKNKSRAAGVTLNYNLASSFDFDGTGPKVGDVFALLLVCRDREKAGHIEEFAVGLIDSTYSAFLMYTPVYEFLGSEAEHAAPAIDEAVVVPRPEIRLKATPQPFIPPEAKVRAANDDE